MDRILALENPHGYSIEIGNTSHNTTLDERIQAAKIASTISKQIQRQNSTGKISLINSRSAPLGKGTHSQNMTVKKTTIGDQDLNRKIRCLQPFSNTHFEPTANVSVNLPQPKSTNLQDLSNSNSSLDPHFKGSMQKRLEAIKNKKMSCPTLRVSCSILESTKRSNTSSATNISFEDAQSKNLNSYRANPSFPQRPHIRSTVQKSSYDPNIAFEHCNRTRNITNTSKNVTSSVQNRLIKAKEEIKAKSKQVNQNNVTKSESVQEPLKLYSENQASSSSLLKYKNKAKRLNQTGSSIKKNKPFISSNWNINKVIKHQPSTIHEHTVHYKPTMLNSTKSLNTSASSDDSTNMPSQDTLKKSQQKKLEDFSFVIPEVSSVQQRIQKYTKVQCNNDDSMEWEDVQPENIVNQVNDFRKSKCDYEPMEWTPDSIMHCDQTNLCLVIDTNILLSNLKLISGVVDEIVPDFGYPTIALPWQVLKELDCLKKSENAIGYRAREAARWLLDVFSMGHPRVKGQPMTLKNGKHPDDAILECALNVKERVNVVYLITDDKMLNIKAEVSGITAKNSLWLHNLVVSQKQLIYDNFQDAISLYPIIENHVIIKCIPRLEHIISRILRFAVKRNQKLSSYSKKAWWKIYSLTPPLDLIKCLLKLKEYWNVIAPQQMLKPPQKQVDWLVYFLKDLQETPCESSLTWHEIDSFLKCCSEIMYFLPYEYYGITDFLLDDLMITRRMLRTKTVSFNSTLEDKSLSTDLSNFLNVSYYNSSNINNILLNVLKNVETYCSNIYVASGVKHEIATKKLNCMHSRNMYSTYYNVLDYCNKLSNLIKHMLKIKQMNTEQILKSHIVMDKFSNAIVALNSDYTEINKEKLIDFCLMKEKNVFLNALLSLQNKLSAIKNVIAIKP